MCVLAHTKSYLHCTYIFPRVCFSQNHFASIYCTHRRRMHRQFLRDLCSFVVVFGIAALIYTGCLFVAFFYRGFIWLFYAFYRTINTIFRIWKLVGGGRDDDAHCLLCVHCTGIAHICFLKCKTPKQCSGETAYICVCVRFRYVCVIFFLHFCCNNNNNALDALSVHNSPVHLLSLPLTLIVCFSSHWNGAIPVLTLTKKRTKKHAIFSICNWRPGLWTRIGENDTMPVHSFRIWIDFCNSVTM